MGRPERHAGRDRARVTGPPALRSTTPASGGPAATLGCMVLFLLPFAAVGVFAVVQASLAAQAGRWGQAGFLTIFALVFGGVGVGGIASLVRSRRRLAEGATREQRHPEAPWLWREDWASGQITDSSRLTMWGSWAFAVLWNLVSLPAAIVAVRAALGQGNRTALVALLFPGVGVGLTVWAVRATLRYRRFGVSRLELATLPAAVGHALEGTVRPPAGLRPPEGFRLVLSCLRRETSGSGRSRSTTERLLWQDERRTMGGGAGIPVAFAIPADAVPSDPRAGGDRVLWRLEVTGEVPGVDYAAAFEVPVFHTAVSDTPRTEAERALDATVLAPADYRQPAGSPIQVSTTRRGTEIYYPARNPGMAAGLTVFAAIWLGAIALMIAVHAPIFFPIVFGLFGLLLVYLVLDAWLGVTRVTAERGRVTVATGWLTPRREQALRADEISEVAIRIASQAGNTPYYEVSLVTSTGKRVAAGQGIRDKREAEWLAAMLRTAMQGG
jgi:hypothetical protein